MDYVTSYVKDVGVDCRNGVNGSCGFDHLFKPLQIERFSKVFYCFDCLCFDDRLRLDHFYRPVYLKTLTYIQQRDGSYEDKNSCLFAFFNFDSFIGMYVSR